MIEQTQSFQTSLRLTVQEIKSLMNAKKSSVILSQQNEVSLNEFNFKSISSIFTLL